MAGVRGGAEVAGGTSQVSLRRDRGWCAMTNSAAALFAVHLPLRRPWRLFSLGLFSLVQDHRHAACVWARIQGAVSPPLTHIPAQHCHSYGRQSPLCPRLPVVEIREQLAAALQAHDVCVVSGETGSGKTTQVPTGVAALPNEDPFSLHDMGPTFHDASWWPVLYRAALPCCFTMLPPGAPIHPRSGHRGRLRRCLLHCVHPAPPYRRYVGGGASGGGEGRGGAWAARMQGAGLGRAAPGGCEGSGRLAKLWQGGAVCWQGEGLLHLLLVLPHFLAQLPSPWLTVI